MPRPIRYTFGGVPFTSQAAVKKYAAAIRERHEDFAPISDPNDFAFLLDLLRCHVDAEQKMNGGVTGFFVAGAPEHFTRCFWVRREIGEPTDFGVPACIEGVGRLNRASLRQLVKPDIEEFRTSRLLSGATEFCSDYSGMRFPIATAVVDHFPVTFEMAVKSFFLEKGIDIETTLLTVSVDQKSGPVWADEKLAQSFQAYHKQLSLRLVNCRENLSEIKREATR